MADKAPRHMKYPYTLTAQIRQFPFKYHFNNNWIYRYYTYAFFVTLPVFAYIHKVTHSPANWENYREYKRKEDAEHHHQEL